jgi:glycosyltransferase involved in cell wall biosynthesis
LTPKRIVLAINSAWNVVNFRAGLVRALLEDGHRVIVFAPGDGWSARVRELGAEFHPIGMDRQGTSPIRDGVLLLRYWRALRQVKPDVVLTYTPKPNIYGSLAAHALGIPVVNNVAGLGTAFIRDSWLTRLVERLYRASFGRSARVFFQNQEDLDQFVAAGLAPANRSRLLPGSGIDLSAFSAASSDPRARREGAFVFLLVARLLWDKGLAEYVEAARLVKQARPDARFQILGPLDAGNRTVVGASEVAGWVSEGAVDYLGEAEDVRPYVAAADCIVLPSYREGLPRALLEGAAMGKPLIATDVQGCRSVVEHGVNGYLCAPRSGEALAEAMLQLLALPEQERTALGQAARRIVEESFDERIVIARYRDAIAAAAGERDG